MTSLTRKQIEAFVAEELTRELGETVPTKDFWKTFEELGCTPVGRIDIGMGVQQRLRGLLPISDEVMDAGGVRSPRDMVHVVLSAQKLDEKRAS